MTELLTYLAAHGLAIALGVLLGAATATAWLASLLKGQQVRRDEAYLDGYEAGVRETKVEIGIQAMERLGKSANR